MILSILIPTMASRKPFLEELMADLRKQIDSLPKEHGEVEIIIDQSEPPITTGHKRNNLLEMAKGKYVWFIDDDDILFPGGLRRVVEGMQFGVDVIGIDGVMTTNGTNLRGWEIRLGHPYSAITKHGKEYYLRFPNHITPILREHAIKVKFEDLTIFEDYKYATALKNLGCLQTQYIVDHPVYHYRHRTNK